MSTLKEKYEKDIVPELIKKFSYSNKLAVPKLLKITINVGLGEATINPKAIEAVVSDLSQIAGQKPVVTKAKKAIAGFKIRQGQAIGVMVTLRGQKMYDFLEKLVTIVLPKVRDFRGVSEKSFDKRGNYTLGLKEQVVFPEIDYSKVEKIRGLEIVVNTSAKNDQEAKALLELLGMPFRKVS
ncbi:MAG: 50S ribosomal protein L5 [Patescibacteria group bacterium]|nr:50S ribosomal protein L5 [Patescibacteria group bacterium]